ncbi:hypothetical protein TrVFT333_006249 [Trichoderma virens FT-333]|nr:hypothetical protein TrVFT333_006249 [Trichoderma virens FT-333]
MDLTRRHQDCIIDEADRMELSWENTYVDPISTFKGTGSDSTNSRGDVVAEVTSRSSLINFDGCSFDSASIKSGKEEWVDDNGSEFSPQQLERPRRSLANTHIPPPDNSIDDDEEDSEEEDRGFSGDEIEVFLLDFSGYTFEVVTGRNGPLISDNAGPSPLATGESSVQAHDDQGGLQDATFSASFRILDAKVQSGKRGELCCHKQAQPKLRAEDENIESNAEKRVPRDDNGGGEPGDFVMVEGEEEETEEMTDSCLNLISHLDYVMFPTAEVLEFVRGGEMEVLEDTDSEEGTCRRFLSHEYSDEDNKELGMGELENRGRRWYRLSNIEQLAKVPHFANKTMQILTRRNGARN